MYLTSPQHVAFWLGTMFWAVGVLLLGGCTLTRATGSQTLLFQ